MVCLIVGNSLYIGQNSRIQQDIHHSQTAGKILLCKMYSNSNQISCCYTDRRLLLGSFTV
ncbi:MAG: hypothetical protein DBY25_07250 [Clostridiales bacterium]|nr:MAG: hypothetical protein DBY25_07250 [Clostridiales bacterium]